MASNPKSFEVIVKDSRKPLPVDTLEVFVKSIGTLAGLITYV